MSDQKVLIEMEAHGRGRVFIGGVEVHGIVRIEFVATAQHENKLTLHLEPAEVRVTGTAEVLQKSD